MKWIKQVLSTLDSFVEDVLAYAIAITLFVVPPLLPYLALVACFVVGVWVGSLLW